MTARTRRPVYLNLLQIRLPVAGVASIMHRISGFALVLVLPLLLWLLQHALQGEQGFAEARALVQSAGGRLLLFLLMWAFAHHLLMGFRHLALDVHLGLEKPLFRHTAWAVMLAAPVLALLLVWGLS